METFLPIIGLAGILLAITGYALSFLVSTQGWLVTLCEGAALFCLIVYAVGNWRRLQTFSKQRSTRMGTNSVLAILLLLGILMIINFLTIRHGSRWDLSETQRFTLSPQTYKVLGELQKPVSVMVFSHEKRPKFSAYRDFLESFTHASPHITVQFIDPEKNPTLTRKYDITSGDTAVFESGTQVIHVSQPTEVELMSALIRVTKETKKEIWVLKGHGERRINDREKGGLSLAKEKLTKQGYEVTDVSSLEMAQESDKATVLIISGPKDPLNPEELDTIKEFLSSGGRLLLLVDPNTSHGLDSLVHQWGVELGPGIIVDPKDRVAQGSPTALLVKTFTEHAVTHDMSVPIILPVSRGVTVKEQAGVDWEFTSLAHTSDESWAEMNLENTSPSLDPEEDLKGPIILAGALELQNDKTDSAVSKPTIVIIGNSTFVSNAYLTFPGNTDFFLRAIAWLAGEQSLISISPKDPALRPFIPNPTQEQMLFAVQVFSLPVLFLLAGITVWRRRRRL